MMDTYQVVPLAVVAGIAVWVVCGALNCVLYQHVFPESESWTDENPRGQIACFLDGPICLSLRWCKVSGPVGAVVLILLAVKDFLGAALGLLADLCCACVDTLLRRLGQKTS